MMMTTTPDLDVDDYQFPLPGFRFHPTDEELVDYYLRRKVEKKSIAMELIKQIDIYKHNPWDLPHVNGTLGEKECYVFVKRGRKYKNSVRPNRVTGSGFWKATGIDKPIYSGHGVHHCIGLKKTLVYYRGSAGRGVKTEWMMHEFRLPPSNHNNSFDTQFGKTKDIVEEAEIWTLCRIFKRSISCKRYTPNWKEIPATKTRTVHGEMKSSKTISNTMDIAQSFNGERETETNFISFSSPFINFEEKKPLTTDQYSNQRNQLMMMKMKNSNNSITGPPASEFSPSPPLSMNVSPASSGFSSFDDHEVLDDLFGSENWDELRSLVDFAFDP